MDDMDERAGADLERQLDEAQFFGAEGRARRRRDAFTSIVCLNVFVFME
jgi:hypothetical protein